MSTINIHLRQLEIQSHQVTVKRGAKKYKTQDHMSLYVPVLLMWMERVLMSVIMVMRDWLVMLLHRSEEKTSKFSIHSPFAFS